MTDAKPLSEVEVMSEKDVQYWKRAVAAYLPHIRVQMDMAELSRLLATLDAARAKLAEVETLLRDAKDSLEYVDTAHPGTTGWGVRRERVAQIDAWLAARAPTEPHA